MKNSSNRIAAFTLLELLVVLGIMSLLGGIGMSALSGIRSWMKRQSDRAYYSEIQSALRLYYLDRRAWPAGISSTECDLTGEATELMEALQPYMESPFNREVLETDFASQAVLLVLDIDRDHWIRASDFDRLEDAYRPEKLWERVAIYSLGSEGELLSHTWNP